MINIKKQQGIVVKLLKRKAERNVSKTSRFKRGGRVGERDRFRGAAKTNGHLYSKGRALESRKKTTANLKLLYPAEMCLFFF